MHIGYRHSKNRGDAVVASKEQAAKKYKVLHKPGETLLARNFAKVIAGFASKFFFHSAAGQIDLG